MNVWSYSNNSAGHPDVERKTKKRKKEKKPLENTVWWLNKQEKKRHSSKMERLKDRSKDHLH